MSKAPISVYTYHRQRRRWWWAESKFTEMSWVLDKSRCAHASTNTHCENAVRPNSIKHVTKTVFSSTASRLMNIIH